MNINLARKMSSLALYLVKKEGSFTSKDKKLHITYDQWSDYLSIFLMKINPNTQKYSNATLVFQQNIDGIEKFNEGDEEWQIKLIEEHSKRS